MQKNQQKEQQQFKPFVHHGRIFVKFDEDLVDTYNNGTQLKSGLWVPPTHSASNPADHNVELGHVVAARPNSFFKKGDRVLIHYDVFIRGKFQHLQKGEAEKTIGDGIYHAHDGTTSTYNSHQVFAKWENDGWVPAPGSILIKGQAKKEESVSSGGIIIPADRDYTLLHDGASGEDVERMEVNPWSKVFIAEVLYSNMEGVVAGDRIHVSPYGYVPINTGNMAFVQEDNVLTVFNRN